MNNVRTWFASKDLPGFKVDRDSYLAMALGFLLGRTAFADSLSPFGPALYAGARGVGGTVAVFVGLGVLAGSAALGRWDILGYHALSMLLTTVLIRPDRKRNYPAALDALIAGASIAVSRGIVNAVESPTLYAFMFALLEGMCAVVLSILARSALERAKDQTPLQLERRSESLLVLLLLAIGGLSGFMVFGISVATITVMIATLLAGHGAGPGPGAIAGLSGGLVLSLTGMEDPGIIGMLGASGVLAGIGGWFGKVESVLGYLSAGLLMSLYSNAATPLISAQRLAAQAVASIPMFFVTPKAARALAGRFPLLAQARHPEKLRIEIEPSRLRAAAVSHALSEVSSMLAASSGAQPQSQEGNLLPSPSASALLKQVTERVCRQCERQPVCWEDEFGDTYQAFSDFIMQMAVSGRVSSASDTSGLADRCLRFSEVIAEISHYRELERLQSRLKAMDGETRECLAFQYKCLGQLLSPRLSAEKAETRRTPRSRLKVTLRGDTLPAEGGEKAGDIWVKYDLDPHRVLAVLVDGMGKGEKAAEQSRETLSVLKSLLDCGLDYDSCVSFLNSALFLSCRPDSFVALDCLLVDQETERAYFHKLGAPPSFIRKKDGNVLVVRGQKPPAGAFSSVPAFATSEPIAPDDTIFMVSDGVFRSSPIPARAEHLLVSKLRRLKDEPLEAAVKALLGYGQKVRGQEPPDDVTVVAARIDRV